jgi:hypothetical protein
MTVSATTTQASIVVLDNAELAFVSGGAQMDGGRTEAQMDGKNG